VILVDSIETKVKEYEEKIAKQKEQLMQLLATDGTLITREFISAIIKEVEQLPGLEHEWIHDKTKDFSFVAWKISEIYQLGITTSRYLASNGCIVRRTTGYERFTTDFYSAEDYEGIDRLVKNYLINFITKHGILLDLGDAN